MPAVADPERRRQGDQSLRRFCESYFPHLFNLAWSGDHLRVLAKIERVVREHETLAVAMPRGSGKTTLALTAVCWAILSGKHVFVYLITNTEERARELLGNIKRHLANNRLLAEDYPEAVYPIRRLDGESRRCNGQRYYGVPTQIGWGVDELVLPTIPGSISAGAIIRVAGLTGNIRGALYVRPDGSQVRPSLVICDDPQTDASARSMIQTAERLEIINGAVRGLAGPGRPTAIIIPCTVIQEGDLADQLLNRSDHPTWHGERTKMVYSFPTNTKLWEQYARVRDESLRADGDGHDGTELYGEHRCQCGRSLEEAGECEGCPHRTDCMDAGAVVAWPARHNPSELSALQHAMNLRLADEAAFQAEYQNEPLRREEMSGLVLTPRQVVEKANGRPAGQVPLGATRIVGFIDVHQSVLFWCICAWQDDFTGYVIEYGTFPQQPHRVFTMDRATRTLGEIYRGMGPDGAIMAGLSDLVAKALGTTFRRGQGAARMDRLLVDIGYKPEVVGAVKHKCGGAAMELYLGRGIRAANRPMSEYQRRRGETLGHHWYRPNVRRTGEFPHVAADVNYWKSWVHAALAIPLGDPGCLSLWGKAKEHELFAEHVASSETWVETVGRGRVVHEWAPRPGKPDNHWFDCLVGCAVGASLLGVTVPGQQPARRARKRYTQSDLAAPSGRAGRPR